MLPIFKLLRVLNSDTQPAAIAAAVCLALLMGFTPIASPHNVLVVLLVLLLRVHLGTFLVALTGFSLMALAVESLLDQFGLYLLTLPSLTDFWTAIYNTQMGRLSFFNYSTQLGGLAVGLMAFVPLWLILVWAVRNYRQHVMAWVMASKLMILVRSSSLYQLYSKAEV